MKKSRDNGFTALEILTILFLLGIVFYGIAPNFGTHTSKVKTQVHEANIKRIEGAAQLYRLDVGTFPTRVEDLISKPEGVLKWRGPYLDYHPANPLTPGPYQIDSSGKVK